MANKGMKFPPEVLDEDEVKRFFAGFPRDTPVGKRNLALCLVYARAALRCNEALALRPCDIDWSKNSLTVMCGKGGKRRVVGIDPASLEVAKEWAAVRPKSEWFFCSMAGERIHDSYIRRMVKKQAQVAGIERRMHVHGMRHLAACGMADRGIDIRIVSRQLGHSSLATTARYLDHLRPNTVVEAVSAIQW